MDPTVFRPRRPATVLPLLALLLAFPAARCAKAAPDASSPARGPAAAKQAAPGRFAAFDHFYGLYVGGKKVGWMHATYAPTPTPTLGFSLTAKVAGMGKAASVTLREERRFGGPGQQLVAIDFEQRSDTGAVQVKGVRRGQKMELTTRAGGAQQTTSLVVPERLEDDMALLTLARGAGGQGAPVGAKAQAQHLDASTQTMVEAQMVVDEINQVTVAGVQETTRKITTAYPALKVREVSHVDGHGKLLSTQVGGFFEARLEDEAVAKAPAAVQDVLLGSVVKVPREIDHVADADRLELLLAGLDAEDELPSAPRQQVTRDNNNWRVQLQRDPNWAGLYTPPWRPAAPGAAAKEGLPAEIAAALRPSAYIQSEAKEIRQMARASVGDANDVGTAVARLCDAVGKHLHAEYVPAFSNALEAYHSRRGDCTEHSVLFAALARAAGLPARPVVGIAYWPAGGGFGWHAWVEVWHAGRWRQVDPTWGQTVADVTHLKLADGGPLEQASVVMLLGKVQLVAWQVTKL